jgi:sterol desaturase/sphingolipid hydroxylase (fatty acid hydroxylase superfamily)
MYELSVLELILFAGLFLFEQTSPARIFPMRKTWAIHWCVLIAFASLWLMGLMMAWTYIPPIWLPLQNMTLGWKVLIAYLTYSLVAYWYHRIRHSNKTLWYYIHYMHHAPAHMDTRVTFWRHPLEILLDSLVVIFVGKMLGSDVDIIFYVLIIESILEIFHHSNIHTPKRMRWLGYLLQLPEQHLIHHQRGLHRWNYGTLTLWDTLFRTVQVPNEWYGKVGLLEWESTKKLLLFRYKKYN